MKASVASVLVQIILIDMVFSLDSVTTAVGMVDQVSVMIAAVTVAIVVMLFFTEAPSSPRPQGRAPQPGGVPSTRAPSLTCQPLENWAEHLTA